MDALRHEVGCVSHCVLASAHCLFCWEANACCAERPPVDALRHEVGCVSHCVLASAHCLFCWEAEFEVRCSNRVPTPAELGFQAAACRQAVVQVKVEQSKVVLLAVCCDLNRSMLHHPA